MILYPNENSRPLRVAPAAQMPAAATYEVVDRSQWTDAAIAAEAAALALGQGRFRLGFAFAKLALDANRAEVEQGLPWSPPAEASGPPVFEQAQTQMFGPPSDQTATIGVPRSARCIAMVEGGECHAVVTFNEADSSWYHLDPAHDGHMPIPPDQA